MGENILIAPKTVAGVAAMSELVGPAVDFQTKLPEVYLHPGQSHVASSPVALKMILGSCAGVFLFDPNLEIGGATHFMLPCHGEGDPSPRYGDVALKGLLDRFHLLGSFRRDLQAKIFGGAGMLQALQGLSGSRIGQIGRRNIEIAYEILGRESVAIVEKSVFGSQGRKVSMASNTGEIALQFVSNADGNR